MKRVGWCMAIKVGKRFMAIPGTTRSNRNKAIEEYYRSAKDYKRQKRMGYAKTIAVFANVSDLCK